MQAARAIAERVDELEARLKVAERYNTILGLGWPQWMFVCIVVSVCVVLLNAHWEGFVEALRQWGILDRIKP